MDELRAEWLDTIAQIDAIDKELAELAVCKQSRSMRASVLARRKARLMTIKQEWENLIREAQNIVGG